MSERATPATVQLVDYVCDACGKGVMECTSAPILMSHPPKIEHKCTHCGASQYFTTTYPTWRFVREQGAEKTALTDDAE